MPHYPICANTLPPFPPGPGARKSSRLDMKCLMQCLLEPGTKLQLAVQVCVFSFVTGLMLGLVATQVSLGVAIFIAMILGAITLPIAHWMVKRQISYYWGVLILLGDSIVATVLALAAAWLVFGYNIDGTDVYAAFSATLFMNMVYLGFALERRRAVEMERLVAESQMRLLQTQINPHFLSNTLANVSALIDSDPPGAQNLLHELVSFMSDLVYYSRQETITLADALDSLETHMQIHRMRLGDRLAWSVDVPAELHWQPLLPLIVLPLMENAVVHGVNTVAGKGWIKFSARADAAARRWWFAVTNSGSRDFFEKSHGHGIAINNIHERLRMRYGTSARLELFWMDDSTYCARVTLPLVDNPRDSGVTTTRVRPHS